MYAKQWNKDFALRNPTWGRKGVECSHKGNRLGLGKLQVMGGYEDRLLDRYKMMLEQNRGGNGVNRNLLRNCIG